MRAWGDEPFYKAMKLKGTNMLDAFELRSHGMPTDMQVLLTTYPRDQWEAHPGFKEKTKNWLDAHNMFRQLGAIIRSETELFLDKSRSADDFAARLAHYGDMMVRNLHGHHGWEDYSYFPELAAADPRFEAGLEILEKDHQDLDVVLERFGRCGFSCGAWAVSFICGVKLPVVPPCNAGAQCAWLAK